MSVSVCPIAIINAPIERVWTFLSEPANYALWRDAQTRSIVPDGRAQSGQKIHAESSGLFYPGTDKLKILAPVKISKRIPTSEQSRQRRVKRKDVLYSPLPVSCKPPRPVASS
jgi:hypothetical protein